MQSVTPTPAERNRQQNAVNLIARHLSDRPARHIVRRVMGELVVWLVESQTTVGVVYNVTLAADGWPVDSCDCEDCRTRHMTCKHIRAAQALAQPAQPQPQAIKWTSDSRKANKRTEIEEEI